MAMSTDIRYISFYTDGSAAKKVERKPVYKPVAAPKPVVGSKKRILVRVDPVAVAGIVLAVVMFFSLISAFNQYNVWARKNAQMGQYILTLQQEQVQLRKTYEEGYDLAQIQQIAEAIGMVPIEQAQHITVDVHLPEVEQGKSSLWEEITIFLAGLFA